MTHNGWCMCNAGLKVRIFQNRTEQNCLFNISNFMPSVKNGLAVFQQSAAVGLSAKTRIKYDTLCVPYVHYTFL